MLTKADTENALPELLRPIVSLCIRFGIKFVDLEKVLKRLFVHEAEKQVGRDSISKLSVMTGIQRPQVQKLLLSPINEIKSSNLIMSVIDKWSSKKPFCTKGGKAKILNFEGKKSEFAELVRSVSKNLNPYTVLFELERSKLVVKTPKGLKLLSNSFIANSSAEKGFNFLSSDLGDLVASVVENLDNPGTTPNHHLTTEYMSIPTEKETELKKLLLREGEKIHLKLRRLFSRSENKSRNRMRVAFCSFVRFDKGLVYEKN